MGGYEGIDRATAPSIMRWLAFQCLLRGWGYFPPNRYLADIIAEAERARQPRRRRRAHGASHLPTR